jgi:predicted DNA-binding transcriptional regulator YafY
MLETSARLLRLLSLLQAQPDWPGAELAARLDVDVRTVRRDVERLRTLGYPVHATSGVAGGYRLGAGAALPPLLLDDDEAVAVVVGLRTAAGGSVSGIEEISLRALAKLEKVLPTRLRHRVNALNAATVSLTGPGSGIDVRVLTVIAGACRDHERLRFDYGPHDGKPAERTVEPLRLACTAHRWYLLAFDLDRDDWRTFRVDRMAGIPATSFRFTPREPPAEDVAAYISRSISTAPYQHRFRLLVHAPAEVVAREVPPTVGLIEALDEHRCVLHTGSSKIDEVPFYLAQQEFDFEVDGPPELVDRLRAVADRFSRAIARGPVQDASA